MAHRIFDDATLEAGWSLEGEDGEGRTLKLAFSDRELMAASLGVTIGRHPQLCERVIDDQSVSRRHLRLALRGGSLYGEDLHSLNGTMIDGSTPRPFEPMPLATGQRLALGLVELTLRRIAEG